MLRAPLPLALGLLLLAPPAAPAQQFVRDSTALVSPATWTNGVATADLDGDGDVDIAFANGSTYGAGGQQPQRLYLNDGSGTFSNASAQLNVADFNAQMVIAEDADLDGDLDLAYAPAGPFPATTQRVRLLVNDGSAVFADETAGRMPATTVSSWSLVAADLDNDGIRDLVVANGSTSNGQGAPAQSRIFRNDGSGHYSDVTATWAPVDLYACHDVIAFDYDGDFDLDVAFSGIGQPGQRGSLWLNDGTGQFTRSPILDDLCGTQSYEVDWSDLDGDGDFDSAVQGISGFDEGWAQNRGPDIAPPETVFAGANGDDDNELATMDYDMDGDLDVFVGSLGAPREKVYRSDGGGLFTSVDLFSDITDSTLDLAFADLDGDGDADVVTAQGESGVQINRVYENTGPTDSLPPRVLAAEVPTLVPGAATVFRLVLQDGWVDDGLTSALASATWETFADGRPEASGGGPATDVGGCMWRVSVPTTAATGGVRVTWQPVDLAGNAADPVVVSVGDVGLDAWSTLGPGLAGSGGLVPSLAGSGPLAPSSANTLALTDALASASAALVVGLSQLSAPFKGGLLLPTPDLLLTGLATDAAGTLELPFVWPAGIPGGVSLFVQAWIFDPGGPAGFAASNGLEGLTSD